MILIALKTLIAEELRLVESSGSSSGRGEGEGKKCREGREGGTGRVHVWVCRSRLRHVTDTSRYGYGV